MDASPIEALEVADGDFLGVPVEFTEAEGGDGELILYAFGVVLAFLHKASFYKVGVAPREATDEGKLGSGHCLRFGFGDVKVLGELVEKLGAGEGFSFREAV